MINKYIEELVKTASVTEKLETHLHELTKQAAAEVAREEFLKNASAADLAKLAGLTLPEDACPSCAGKMEKLGSVYQCSCGMLKKAGPRINLAGAAEAVPSLASRVGSRVGEAAGELGFGGSLFGAPIGAATGRLSEGDPDATPRSGVLRGAAGGALGGMLGAAPGALLRNRGLMALGGTLGTVAGGVYGGRSAKATPEELIAHRKGQLLLAQAQKTASVEKVASERTFNAALHLSRGDVDKALNVLESAGYTKLAGPFLTGLANTGKAALEGLKGVGQAAWGGAKNLGGRVAQSYRLGTLGVVRQGGKAGEGALANMTRGGTLETQKSTGLLGGLAGVAKTHPGVAAGAAAVPVVAGGGYMMGKRGSAMLIEVGDAAGRIMAKVAETPGIDIDPEEVAEAIDEAKDRENISGSTRRGGILGGALGAAGLGAAGYGIGAGATRFLGASPWSKAIGAGLGTIGGGVGGGLYGARAGAEDAQANRLVSFLRGRRAYETGAQEGLQQGYMAGMTQGGMGGEEEGGLDPR